MYCTDCIFTSETVSQWELQFHDYSPMVDWLIQSSGLRVCVSSVSYCVSGVKNRSLGSEVDNEDSAWYCKSMRGEKNNNRSDKTEHGR